MSKRMALIAGVILILVCTPVVALFSFWPIHHWSSRRMFAGAAQVGMTKEQVIHSLGKPRFVSRSLDELREMGKMMGYVPLPTAPVDREVLVFDKRIVWRAYVYIGKDGRVSRVLLART